MCAHATEIRQVDQGRDGGGLWKLMRLWCAVCGWQGQAWKVYE